jgi:mRNA interferase MazF
MKVLRGDVVLVDYPFSDRSGSKIRPVLVVQADVLNRRIDDTILAIITGSMHRASTTQLFVDIATADGALTGLKLSSMVQCENLVTLDCKFIIRKIGKFSPALMQQINACLKSALELP